MTFANRPGPESESGPRPTKSPPRIERMLVLGRLREHAFTAREVAALWEKAVQSGADAELPALSLDGALRRCRCLGWNSPGGAGPRVGGSPALADGIGLRSEPGGGGGSRAHPRMGQKDAPCDPNSPLGNCGGAGHLLDHGIGIPEREGDLIVQRFKKPSLNSFLPPKLSRPLRSPQSAARKSDMRLPVTGSW